MTAKRNQDTGSCLGCAGPVTSGSRTGVCGECYNLARRELHASRLTASEIHGWLEAQEQAVPNASSDSFSSSHAYHPIDWKQSSENYCYEYKTYSDSLVLSDVHAPRHDALLLTRAMKVAKTAGIKRLIIAGDLLDFDQISRHPKQGGKMLSAAEAIAVGVKILDQLTGWFDEIIVLKGNHDARLQTLVERAAENRSEAAKTLALLAPGDEQLEHRQRYIKILSNWITNLAPRTAPKVKFLAQPVCFLFGPPGLPHWRVTHPRAYSRHAPTVEKKLSIKFDQPVLGTHGHIFGLSITPNGKYPVCQFGCSTRPEAHYYLFENETDHPKWVQGFCTVISGRLKLYTNNPYLIDWSEIDEVQL